MTAVETEMAWTAYRDACRDPALIDDQLRECRRPGGHMDEHASGFGEGLRRW